MSFPETEINQRTPAPAGISAPDGNSPVARDCVVELVGLEPTTRVLWNAGVSDQLTLSDTWHSSSKRSAIDGHFYKREISGWKSPVFPARRQPSFPRRHHPRLLLDQPSDSC